MKKTTAQQIEELRILAGNAHITVHTVWNTDQIKDLIDREDKQNNIFKVEITHSFSPGKKCYNIIVWKYPPIL